VTVQPEVRWFRICTLRCPNAIILYIEFTSSNGNSKAIQRIAFVISDMKKKIRIIFLNRGF
jgi:hypothetical protein